MEKNKLISLSIGAVVVVILLATVMMPVFDDIVEDNTTTYYNNAAGNLKYSAEDVDHTLSYTAGGSVVTLDGTDYTLGSTIIYIISDGPIILGSTNGITIYNGATKLQAASAANDVEITMSDGTVSYTYGSSSATGTYTWAYVPDSDGDYVNVAVSSSSTVYYSDFSELATSQSLSNHLVTLTGGDAAIDGTDATVTATTAEQSGTNGEVKYMTGQFTVSDGTNTLKPTYVLAKASLSYENELSQKMGALFAPLPILIIAAMLIAVVGVVLRSRMD